MKYFPMLEAEGLQILAVVLFSTVIVMVSSGLTAGFISSRKERKHHEHPVDGNSRLIVNDRDLWGPKTVSPPAKGLFVTAPDYSCTNCCDIDTNRRIL